MYVAVQCLPVDIGLCVDFTSVEMNQEMIMRVNVSARFSRVSQPN